MRDQSVVRQLPHPRCVHRWRVVALSTAALLVAACSGDRSSDGLGHQAQLVAEADAALTAQGAAQLGELAEAVPVYRLTADVVPATGEVSGTVTADLPVGDADVANLRYFPALVDPGARVTQVEVDGEPVDHVLDTSLLTIPLQDRADADPVELAVSFAFTAPEIPETDVFGTLDAMLGDEALQPANVGLVGRKDGVVNLGHWFPIWVPEGLSTEPHPDGFGDIGNFPVAVIEVELDEPPGWTVVTGGVRQSQDDTRVVEAGSGLRDMSMVLVEDAVTVSADSDDTTVRVVAPAGPAVTDEILREVLDESVTSLEVLSDAFGAYPWEQLDVVATPLGTGVGGMEFPGVVWVESTIFAGGVPGLEGLDLGLFEGLDLGDLDLGFGDQGDADQGELDSDALFDEDSLGEIFGDDFGDLLAEVFDMLTEQGDGLDIFEGLDVDGLDLGDDLGGLDLGGLDMEAALDPVLLGSTRAWVVAHEVAHQWWHAVVGNDSMTAPIVDESLAQYSSCLVFIEAWPERADKVCEANLAGGYQQMRALGVPDAPADRPSDEFESMLQYSGVIYGKAPLFFHALEDHYGDEAVVDALASVVDSYSFEQISSDELHAALSDELGSPEVVTLLWARWFEGTHGDEDILG